MMPQDIRESISRYSRERFAPLPFIPGVTPIPASGKVFDEQEILGGVEAVLDGWWTEGKCVEAFEARFSTLLQRNFTALVNSGSSANLVAFSALTSWKLGDRRVKPGDEVITVAAGFPTTITPIIPNRCIPVFCDI